MATVKDLSGNSIIGLDTDISFTDNSIIVHIGRRL